MRYPNVYLDQSWLYRTNSHAIWYSGCMVDTSNAPREDYRNLWKLLIDRGIRKGELRDLAGLSSSTITKLGRNQTVTTATLGRICKALDCSPNDILAFEDCYEEGTGDGRNE